MARMLRIPVGLALVAIFLAAGYWSVRAAWMESPWDVESHLRRAAQLKQQGADPRRELETAASLSPSDYRIWIDLGLESGFARDDSAAERYLLRAAAESRQFEPRWLLANLYYRRGDAAQFWRWAKEALSISYDDPAPLYRLCWQVSSDGAEIERMIPDRVSQWRFYLRFLVEQDKLAEAQSVAARLLPRAGGQDLPELLVYCDRLLDARQVDRATEIWASLGRRGLIPYPPQPPAGGKGLTNGDFAHEFLGHGFDWMLYNVTGVATSRSPSDGLQIRFSGGEPEQCFPLGQLVPFQGGGWRRLRFEYRTSGIPQAAGLRWVIADAFSGKEVPVEGESLSAESWKWGEVRFSPPPGLRLGRVLLAYRRAPGTTRIEGAIDLRRAELEPCL
jgi:hypothetical protein